MNDNNSGNEQLRWLVDTFMSGYVGLFLASFRTGKIEFIKFKDGLLEHYGVRGEVPEWEELVLLYTTNGIYRDDQATVRTFLDREYLRLRIIKLPIQAKRKT